MLPRLDIWFYAAMLAHMEPVLREADLDVLVYQVDGEAERSRFLRDLPARRKVDAVILTALPMSQAEIDRLDLLAVHVAVAGGRVGDLPRVEVDDYSAARVAVRHLLDLGHRRIAMVRTSDTEDTPWSSDVLRTRGWRDELAAHGLTDVDDHLVTEAFGPGAAGRAMDRMRAMDPPPTAVFAYSDELAMGTLAAALDHGLQVPEDLSIVGVDGHPDAALFGLTTIDQRVGEQGRRVGQMVIALLRGEEPEQEVVVPGELVVRSSTAPPP